MTHSREYRKLFFKFVETQKNTSVKYCCILISSKSTQNGFIHTKCMWIRLRTQPHVTLSVPQVYQ